MIVAIIPARGNSKGLPGKNLLEVGGQTLLERAARSALAPSIDKVFLTSEDSLLQGWLNISDEFSHFELFNRPYELSQDHVQVDEVVLFTLRTIQEAYPGEVDAVVVLQPTSPFRTVEHVEQAVGLFKDMKRHRDKGTKVETLISVYDTTGYQYEVGDHRGDWYEGDELRQIFPSFHKPFRRLGRQEVQSVPLVTENGAIYIVDAERLSKNRTMRPRPYIPFYMSELESLEIDSEHDYDIARFIYEGGYLENNS